MTAPQPPADGTTPPAVPATPPAPVVAPALGAQPQPPAAEPKPEDKKDEPLGPAGLKALQEERTARQELEKKLAALSPLEELAKKLGAVPNAEPSDADKLAEQMAAIQKDLADERALRLKLQVAKTKSLSDAQTELLVGTTAEELNAHADKLLAAFPTAAADGTSPQPGQPPRPPAPDPSQGARGAVDLDAQIAAAEAKGDFRTSIRLKTQRLQQTPQ